MIATILTRSHTVCMATQLTFGPITSYRCPNSHSSSNLSQSTSTSPHSSSKKSFSRHSNIKIGVSSHSIWAKVSRSKTVSTSCLRLTTTWRCLVAMWLWSGKFHQSWSLGTKTSATTTNWQWSCIQGRRKVRRSVIIHQMMKISLPMPKRWFLIENRTTGTSWASLKPQWCPIYAAVHAPVAGTSRKRKMSRWMRLLKTTYPMKWTSSRCYAGSVYSNSSQWYLLIAKTRLSSWNISNHTP